MITEGWQNVHTHTQTYTHSAHCLYLLILLVEVNMYSPTALPGTEIIITHFKAIHRYMPTKAYSAKYYMVSQKSP